jgi:putative ABC transport system permease protein
MLSDLFFRFRSLLHRKSAEAELDAELQFHFEHAVEKNMRAGMSCEEAARRARIAFGGLEQAKEDCRVAWGTAFVEAFLQDIRFGTTILIRSPGFSIIALLTLALGIGATTAILSVVDAVLLRSLPYRDASRLVLLYEDRTSTGFPRKEFTPANYADCKDQKQIFKDVAAIDADRFYNLTSNGAVPERLSAEGVSWNLFSMLGTSPLLGRVFRPEEDVPGADHVVLISHRLWRDRFGGDSSVIGQDIRLNGEKYSVVGVMPSRFAFPNKSADLWIPIAFTSQGIADRGSHYLMVVAKLQHGVSVQRANTELLAFSRHLKQQYMNIMQFVDGFVAEPLQELYTRDVRGGLIVLLAAVGFILLIACANIANLLLSRANVRRREIGLRGALGATQGRIVRQLLTESALLAGAGGIIGVILAHFSFGLLKVLIPTDLSRTISLTLNLSVLGVAILIHSRASFYVDSRPRSRCRKPISTTL